MILLQVSTVAIDKICDNLYKTLNNEFINSGLGVSRYLVAFGLLLALHERYSDFIWNKGKFDAKAWIKPVFIVFLVLNYPILFKGIEGTFFTIANASSSVSLGKRNEAVTKMNEKEALSDEIRQKELEKDLENGNIVTGTIAYTARYIGNMISNQFDNLLMAIARIIYFAVYCLLKIQSFMYLLFVAMFGPIIIGLSQTKFFEGGFPTWIARVCTTLLWIPVMNLVSYIVASIQIEMINNDIADMKGADVNGVDDLFGIIFYIIGTSLYLQVPRIAGFFMESAGVGDGGVSSLFGGMSSFSGALIGAAGGAGKAGMSPASVVLGGMGNAIGSMGKAINSSANKMKSKFNGN